MATRERPAPRRTASLPFHVKLGMRPAARQRAGDVNGSRGPGRGRAFLLGPAATARSRTYRLVRWRGPEPVVYSPARPSGGSLVAEAGATG